MVRCLKKQLGAEIHFLTKSAFAPILESNPYVDRVFSFQKEIPSELVLRLKSEGYDHVVDLHHNLRSLWLKLALGCPASSFNKLNWEKWLLVNFKIDRLPDTHIVHRYLATVKHLGVEYDGGGLDYFIPKEESLTEVELPNEPFIAFAIGATHATKRLPEEKIVEICRGISKPILLLGGNAEQAVGERVAQASGPHVLNLCARLTLHQSALAVQRSRKVITHDTGMMHIAAALRKPIVSIWGSTVPKFGMWPLYPTGIDLNTSVEVLGLNCRPCSKIGFDRCPKGHFKCMRDLRFDPTLLSLDH